MLSCPLMRHIFIILAAAACLMVSMGTLAAEEPVEGFGPFPTRNFSPVQNLFLGMPAERATTIGKGRIQVRLESAQTAKPNTTVNIQSETLRMAYPFRLHPMIVLNDKSTLVMTLPL